MILLSIDPGIDASGVAIWDLGELPPARALAWQAAGEHLRYSGVIRSHTNDPLPERVQQLACGLQTLVKEHGVTHLVIERPSIAGTYSRNRRKATTADGFLPQTIWMMHVALGALIATGKALGLRVVVLPAALSKKAQRSQLVYQLWPTLRRHSNEDQRDAIYLGLMALGDARRRWGQTGEAPCTPPPPSVTFHQPSRAPAAHSQFRTAVGRRSLGEPK